jgi:hypothetical protein
MGDWDGWTLTLLIVGGYVAVVLLVRLMLRRRNELTEQFRREVAKEKARRAATEADAAKPGAQAQRGRSRAG